MLLLPYVTSAPGRFQEEARATLREAIAAGQAEGSVRTGDPALLAATTETAGRGLVLAARSLDDAQREAGLRELKVLLGGYLLAGSAPALPGVPEGRAPGPRGGRRGEPRATARLRAAVGQRGDLGRLGAEAAQQPAGRDGPPRPPHVLVGMGGGPRRDSPPSCH